MIEPKEIRRTTYIDLEAFLGVIHSPYTTTLASFTEYMQTWITKFGADTQIEVENGYDSSEVMFLYKDMETEEEAKTRFNTYLSNKRAKVQYLRKHRAAEIKRLHELKERYPNESL